MTAGWLARRHRPNRCCDRSRRESPGRSTVGWPDDRPLFERVGRMTTVAVDPFADLRLTEWTSCGGCAAKWGASLLTEMVRDMPAGTDPSLLVGLAPFDDAAIYQVSPDVALVSTTDFFPPLVDHPSDFGA